MNFLTYDIAVPTSCESEGLLYARPYVVNPGNHDDPHARQPYWLGTGTPEAVDSEYVIAATYQALDGPKRGTHWGKGLMALEIGKLCWQNNEAGEGALPHPAPRLERVDAIVLAAGSDARSRQALWVDTPNGMQFFPRHPKRGEKALPRVMQLQATPEEYNNMPVDRVIQAGPLLGASTPAYVALRGFERIVTSRQFEKITRTLFKPH